ncbi:heterokaryon incompatibility protein-domain-containing protein, partial [Bisporella sp. PMI_857]
LPKTFQDTILVAQRLNISYIWIDSLCIIQDSAEDWQAESAIMGQIYSNCTLNIAAAGASDGSVGLFFERDIRLVKPVEVI